MSGPKAVPAEKINTRYIKVSRYCHLLIFVSVVANVLPFALVLYASVIFHECSHLAVCKILDVKTSGIHILPYGAKLKTKLPVCPKKQIAISLAGPLFSLVVFGIAKCFGLISDNTYITFTANTNLMLFALNIIPSVPLDGGEILRSLLSMRYGIINSYKIITYISYAMEFVFVILGIMLCAYTGGNISLIIIALIILNSIIKIKNTIIYVTGSILTGCIPCGKKIKLITKHKNQHLTSAIKHIGFDYTVVIAVDDGEKYIGFIWQSKLLEQIKIPQTFGECVEKL